MSGLGYLHDLAFCVEEGLPFARDPPLEISGESYLFLSSCTSFSDLFLFYLAIIVLFLEHSV